MAEIGQPERRRVLVPQTIPAEPNPYVEPPKVKPAENPAEAEPEKVP